MTFYQALKQVNGCTYFLLEIFLALIFMELKNFKGEKLFDLSDTGKKFVSNKSLRKEAFCLSLMF